MNDTIDLAGCYDICFSPDDEAETGKGFYADLIWKHQTSPLFSNRSSADAWAKKHGGKRCLRG